MNELVTQYRDRWLDLPATQPEVDAYLDELLALPPLTMATLIATLGVVLHDRSDFAAELRKRYDKRKDK